MWQKLFAPGERRGNTVYVVRGQDRWGKEYEVGLKTTNARIARRRALRYQTERNDSPPDSAAPVAPAPGSEHGSPAIKTLRDATERYIEFRHPNKAELARLARMLRFRFSDEDGGATLAERDVARLGQAELVTFARSEFMGCKNSTLNREALRPYAAVLHYAATLKWREDPTLRAFEEEEVEREPAAGADVARLIANVEQVYPSPHGIQQDRAATHKMVLLLLLWERGPRISDALRLKRETDLDLAAGRVRFVVGKARNKVKWVPISRELVTLLGTLSPCADGYVFPWRTRFGVYKWLRDVCTRAGVKFTPHQARHAMATELLEANVDLKVVQELGAWASYESVRRTYQHVRLALMRQADADRRTARGGKA